MEKKTIIIIFLIVLSIQVIWSQKGYAPGYIILNNQDTVYGYVKDRNIKKNILFDKIRFKKAGSLIKKYAANQILGYKIGSNVFESKWFEEDVNLKRIRYTHKVGIGEKVFLRLELKGNVSVYTKEFLDVDCLISDFKLFLKKDSESYQRATQGLFGLKRKKLITYFDDCPELADLINNRKFRYPLEVANFYNGDCQ